MHGKKNNFNIEEKIKQIIKYYSYFILRRTCIMDIPKCYANLEFYNIHITFLSTYHLFNNIQERILQTIIIFHVVEDLLLGYNEIATFLHLYRVKV